MFTCYRKCKILYYRFKHIASKTAPFEKTEVVFHATYLLAFFYNENNLASQGETGLVFQFLQSVVFV